MTGFTYKSYNFQDKDPIIDEVRGVINHTGWTYKRIADESGVSTQTLNKWFDGSTRRPQAASVNAVLRSMGFKLGIVPHTIVSNITDAAPKATTVEDVVRQAKAAKTVMRHVVQMNKYRGK